MDYPFKFFTRVCIFSSKACSEREGSFVARQTEQGTLPQEAQLANLCFCTAQL